MAPPLVSQRKANTTFNGLLMIGLGALFFTNLWWPGILVVIGFALIVKQYLRGRIYDAVVSFLIFGGLTFAALFNWTFAYLIPVLFTVAGLYILYSEWFVRRDRVNGEKIEDINKEIDDAERP